MFTVSRRFKQRHRKSANVNGGIPLLSDVLVDSSMQPPCQPHDYGVAGILEYEMTLRSGRRGVPKKTAAHSPHIDN